MFKSEDDFRKIIGRLKIDDEPTSAYTQNLRQRMLAVFNEAQQKTHISDWQTLRRTLMKSPITKLVAAAVIIIAATIAFYHFRSNASPTSSEHLITVDTSKQQADNTTMAKLVPLRLELPTPVFEGTPPNILVPNLETPRPAGQERAKFYVPEGTENVALGKSITSSDEVPIVGKISMITDGGKEAADDSYVELGPFLQHVTIDLGAEYEIYAVVVWHNHKQPQVYFDVVVQIADDADFLANVNTIFNNDHDNSAGLGIGGDKNYIETYEGKLIDAKGVHGRYVRLYSNGSNTSDLNDYIEVEIYGKPVD